MKLIRLACGAGVILVSGGCAENLTAPPAAGPDRIVIRGPANAGGREPLIVVDGRVLQDNREAQQIAPDQIERLDVLKGPAAVDRYGAPGANGAILITTRPPAAVEEGSVRIIIREGSIRPPEHWPLLVVDGVALPDGTPGPSPEQIRDVHVIKGPDAVSTYGSRAIHGAVVIRTRR